MRPIHGRPEKGKAILAKHWTRKDSKKANNIIIEYCCGRDSAIGQYTDDALVVRFTEEDDLTKKETVSRLIKIAEANRGAYVLLWASIPCTGGSPFQSINIARGMDPQRLEDHWKLFRKVWTNFEKVAKRIIKPGGMS